MFHLKGTVENSLRRMTVLVMVHCEFSVVYLVGSECLPTYGLHFLQHIANGSSETDHNLLPEMFMLRV
jgi:hypothetical protein